ncbi:carboxymuconolactone decarboxylase family protein [Streptomyces sp. NPDC001719]
MAAEYQPGPERAADFDQSYQRGRDTFDALVPGGCERLDRIFALSPDLAQMAVGIVYGHLHHRQALDTRTREVAALAAIIASGMCGTPLSVHVRTALAAGLAPAEIVEVVLECAAFAGFPRAISALPTIEEAFNESGTGIPSPCSSRQRVLDAIDEARHRDATPQAEGAGSPWVPLLAPDTELDVRTLAPDQVLVVVTRDGLAGGLEQVIHVRVEDQQIVKVTPLVQAQSLQEADEVAAGQGISARHALARLLEDLRVIGDGPGTELIVPDPDLLDQVTPLRKLLAAGIRPRVFGVDVHTSIAVFPTAEPSAAVVAIAFCDTDRIRRIHVVQAG